VWKFPNTSDGHPLASEWAESAPRASNAAPGAAAGVAGVAEAPPKGNMLPTGNGAARLGAPKGDHVAPRRRGAPPRAIQVAESGKVAFGAT
jgi:hypothetical protein